jgi:antitoxin component YwqK of YwqJK toxin-antitoxin module
MKKLLLVIITSLTLISCTTQKDFYQNGNLKAKGKITNKIKQGKWKHFYESGKLFQIGKYSNGKETGEWKTFHENGNREAIGAFIDGQRIGIWKSYHTNAGIYTEREWENGKLIRTISCYDEEGKKLDKDTFTNGKETMKLYDIDGNLNFIIHGINGRVPEEYSHFKEKYGIGLIIENCAIDPLSFKRATENNQMIADYLNKKHGEDWLKELSTKPFGIK